MNADQGFRSAPGNLLRVAAGAFIVTAVSAARRAGMARADRGSGPAHGRQVSLPVVPVPDVPADATGPAAPSDPLTRLTAQATSNVWPPAAAPESAESRGPAMGQVTISAALLLFTVAALPAITGLRRAGGKRGAAHARTPGRQAADGKGALPPKIPVDMGDPRTTGVPWSTASDPARRDAEQLRHDVQRPRHADDHSSWPGPPAPYALHPDHPSWGGGRTDPRWDSTEAVLRQDGYPSWPESAAPSWRYAEPPPADDGSGWSGGGRPVPYRGREDRSAAGRSGTSPRPVPSAPAGTNFAPRAGFAPPVSSAAGPSPDSRLASAGYGPRPGAAPYQGSDSRPVSAPPANFVPGPGPAHQAGYAPGPALSGPAPWAGFVPRHGALRQKAATGVMERVRPEVDRVPEVSRVQSAQGQVWDASSAELATWIISEANQQATEITHEARDDAAKARADARQEAATLVQQAADQAAATLAAAELQAAKIRAEILKLSADLGGVATSYARGLLSPAAPATRPTADPSAKPRTPPATEPPAPAATTSAATKLAAPPATSPEAKSATRPASRSAGAAATKPGVSPRRIKPETQAAGKPKNRQVSAARRVTAALVALSLAGVATGATELVLHGPAFFVFRANGAGASQTGPEEDQGPGQPNAPGAHHHAKVIPAKNKAKVIPAKGKHAKEAPEQPGNPA